MQVAELNINQLKDLIKESVIQALKEEKYSFSESILKEVSDAEMKDIIELYGDAPDINTFEDVTEMFNDES